MNITSKLALRHLKLNKLRTTFTSLCVASSICIMIIISAFLGTMFDLMIRSEIEQNGSWHMQFRELTAEQAEKLKSMPIFRSVTVYNEPDIGNSDKFYGEIEFKKVNSSIYEEAQKIAEKIGMEKHMTDGEPIYRIPDNSFSPFNINYHYNLLQFYGAGNSFDSHAKLPITSVFSSVCVLLALVTAVFIYHAYSTSAAELVRYMGLLGSVGASKWQKRACILMESAVTAGVGLLSGCIIGYLSSLLLFHTTRQWLQDFTGTKVVPHLTFSFQMLAFAAIFTCISVFAACLIPANLVSKITIIDAMQNRTKDRHIKKAAPVPKFLRKHCSAEFQMAFKNITYNKVRYVSIIAPIILSMCLFLIVYIFLGYKNGSYDLGSGRIYEQNSIRLRFEQVTEEKVKGLFQLLQKDPSVERARIYKEFLFETAAGIPSDYVHSINGKKPQFYYTTFFANDYPDEYSDQNGSKGKYYPFWVKIMGLDPDAYNTYLEKCDVQPGDFSAPPVIIEDSLIYRLGNKDNLGGSLSLPHKTSAKILLDSPWDEYFFSSDSRPSQIVKGTLLSFPNAFITTQASSINLLEKPGKSINNFFSIYMPMEQFDALADTKALQNLNSTGTKNNTCLYIDLEPKRIQAASFSEKNTGLFHFLSKTEIMRHADEDSVFLEKVKKTAKSIDLEPSTFFDPVETTATYTFSSEWAALAAASENPYPYILQIFSYGILILIAVFSLSNIVSGITASIAVRKREFPVLQSMGMTVKHIRKMLLIENSIYGIFTCIIGIPASIVCGKIFDHHLRQERGLYISLPNWIFAAEALFILIIILFSMINALRQCRKINIIETIRNENI